MNNMNNEFYNPETKLINAKLVPSGSIIKFNWSSSQSADDAREIIINNGYLEHIDNYIFYCQDYISGINCAQKFGKKYSWATSSLINRVIISQKYPVILIVGDVQFKLDSNWIDDWLEQRWEIISNNIVLENYYTL